MENNLPKLCNVIGSVWTSGVMWFVKSQRTHLGDICASNWSARYTFPLLGYTKPDKEQHRIVFQWQIDRKEFRLCSMGTNSYLLFLLADNTGFKFFTLMRHRSEPDGPNACGRNCNNYSLNQSPFSSKQY
jgi:hypothetical protein